jgi:hypothetical protein
MIPPTDLGVATSATFGGLFQARLVGLAAPMVLIDIASTYPTMFSLLNLTPVYACARFEVVERDIAELRAFLADPAAVWDRTTWAGWGMTFAVIRPRGEPLPSSADSGYGFAMRVAPLHLHGGSACFHWADLTAAVARGADPAAVDIVGVFTFVPVGVQPGLGPLRLPTGRTVDLTCEDLGAVLIEERAHVKAHGPRWLLGLLKAVANALTYGLLARADASTLTNAVTAMAYGPSGELLTVVTRQAETPGPHAFLPAAAAVSAAARLVLALVERAITDAGGTVAAVHADSLTVLCTVDIPGQEAGSDGVPAITAEVLHTVLDRFASLGVRFTWDVPAALGAVGLVVGVNRGVFADSDPTTGDLRIVRSSDAGLGGHLADPSDTPGARMPDGRWQWAADCELRLLRDATEQATDSEDRGLRVTAAALPAWTTRPVLRRYSARTWTAVQQVREQSGDPSVQPFTRYLRADAGGPVAIGSWLDARTWADAGWHLDGEPIGLETYGPDGDRHPLGLPRGARAVVRSIAAHLAAWANPHDPGTDGPRRGLRRPTPVHSAPGLTLVTGKDGGELMAADDDPAVSEVEARMTYGTAAGDQLRQRCRAAGLREFARRTGLPYETVRQWVGGGQTTAANLTKITCVLAAIDTDQQGRTCALPVCSRPPRPRSQWCSEAHNKAGRRQAHATADTTGGLPTCPGCGTRFINPKAAELHRCERHTP